MGSSALKDLVDIPQLQAQMDSFYRASSIPVGIIDIDGNILVATGWQDICTKYHRINPDTCAKCRMSDDYIKSNLRVGEYIEYKCQNNMWDLATPIVIKGKHVATLFLGQFFYDDETVDREFFRQQAVRYGFPVESYLDALTRVPVFTRKKVKDIMDYYTQFVQMLINMGLARLDLENFQSNLKKLVDERTASLRESEEKYSQIFHGSRAVKLLINPETGKLTDVNEAACGFYGYTKDELLLKTIFEINLLTTAEIMAEMEAARTEKRNYFNFRHRLSSGESRDVEVYSSPVKIGGQTFLHSIVHDITERRVTEDALHHTTVELQEAQRIAHVGSWQLNNATNKVVWSEELYRMLGLDPDLPPPDYTEHQRLFTPDSWYRLSTALRHTQETGVPYELELEMVRADGSRGWMLAKGEPVRDASGAIIGLHGAAQDITERKTYERTLEETGKRLAEAQRIAKVGDWTWTLSNGALAWSDELYHIFGLDRATYVPTLEKYADLVHSDDRHILLEGNYLENIGKKNHEIEYRIIAQDTGEIKHVLTKGETEFGDDGKPRFVKGTLQDITERKKAEEALRESEEKWKGLFSILPVGVSILDDRNGITEANPELEKILKITHEGLKAGAYRSRKYLRHDNTSMLPDEFPSVAAMRDKKVVRHVEIGVVEEDGETIWTDVSAAPLPFHDATCVVVTADITESKKAQEAVKRSEKLLKEGQSISHFGNWEWDIKTGVNSWSDEQCRIFGYEPGTIDPNYDFFISALHEDDRPMVMAALDDVLNGRAPYNIDCRIMLKDGTLKYINCKGEVERDAAGKPRRMSGTVQDVTERKLMENGLREAIRAAEEATVLKDKFVSLVAHDLKGPLGSMVAYLKQLGRNSFDPEETSKIYGTAIATGENMLSLIGDLLNISRIKTGKLKPELKFVPGYYFAVKAVEEFRYRAEQKGVKIVNEVTRDTRLYADESLFYEVVRNLVSNAIKFTGPGKCVRIFTPAGKLSAIAVSDEGIGIDNARLLHLFEYETKTSTAGTAGEMGTGLGLPLSRDIVEAHGGKLSVESVKGKGSVFCAELPLVKPKVLFACDDRLAGMFLGKYVSGMGLELKPAVNGREAIEMLAVWRPDMVIADIKMPEVDGFELVDRIRKNPATANMPIILTSAFSDPDLTARIASIHVDDFISKPFIEDEVVSKIRRILG